jgi:hypothetical protein
MSNTVATEAAIDKVKEDHRESVLDVFNTIRSQMAPRQEAFNADGVYPFLTRPLSSPFAMGAGFRMAARQGIIRKLNLASVPSRRPENHGHPLPFWIGVN